MMNKPLILIMALAAPILLLPLEQLLPYPAVIEELFKLVAVLWLAPQTKTARQLFIWSLLFGFLFATSETILYLMNIFTLGNLSLVPTRIILTSSLHLTTIGIITLGIVADKRKLGKWSLLCLGLAVLVHGSYNWLIESFNL